MHAIILATHSRYKIDEFQTLLPDYQILPMSAIGFKEEIPEPGQTFAENAQLKAEAIREYLSHRNNPGYIIVAEDSGLCVDALDGRPGVYTARYGGPGCTEHEQRMMLLGELQDIANRKARFECHIACFLPDGNFFTTIGAVYGQITTYERGGNGFAFDQLFESNELHKTFGEATPAEKHSVSHRARAITQLHQHLSMVLPT